jgi:hypothetical protein
MPNVDLDESETEASWEQARENDEADGCAAGAAHEHDAAVCRRGSDCHCARRLGPPTPLAVNRPRS